MIEIPPKLDISSHDIDYAQYVSPRLTSGKILSTCVISMWSNDIYCKYMFMFLLKNLARKGLSRNDGQMTLNIMVNDLHFQY